MVDIIRVASSYTDFATRFASPQGCTLNAGERRPQGVPCPTTFGLAFTRRAHPRTPAPSVSHTISRMQPLGRYLMCGIEVLLVSILMMAVDPRRASFVHVCHATIGRAEKSYYWRESLHVACAARRSLRQRPPRSRRLHTRSLRVAERCTRSSSDGRLDAAPSSLIRRLSVSAFGGSRQSTTSSSLGVSLRLDIPPATRATCTRGATHALLPSPVA